jgi:hypothetical protein
MAGLGLALVGDKLFAAGGYDGEMEVLALVESFDLATDIVKGEWAIEVSVSVFMSCCACIMMDHILANMYAYPF